MFLRTLAVGVALASTALSIPLDQHADLPKAAFALPRPHPEARAINPVYVHGGAPQEGEHQYKTVKHDGKDYPVPGSRKRAINPVYVHGGQQEEGEHQYKTVRHGDKDYVVPGSRRTESGMRILEDVDFDLYFSKPSAINPIYLNHSGEGLYKRAESGPLYGSGGQPKHTDVHQTTNPDCGFASFLAAAAYSNPGWISSRVKFSGDYSDVSSATVSLSNLKTFAPADYTITHSETESNSDIDPATGIWWPGLFDHAALKIGMDSTDGRLGPVGVNQAIAAVTGKEATAHDNLSADDIFDLAMKAASEKTPMVIQTPPAGARTLVANHAYALLGGTGSGANRKITLYNPWGDTSEVPLAAAAADIQTVWSVKGYPAFAGDAGGGQQNDPEAEPDVKTTAVKTSKQATAQPTSAGGGRTRTGGNRPRPTPTDDNRVVNAQVNVVTEDSAPKVQDRPKDDGVVWVTEVEVVTVYVHA